MKGELKVEGHMHLISCLSFFNETRKAMKMLKTGRTGEKGSEEGDGKRSRDSERELNGERVE